MTSSNGNIFRVTGHLCGEFTGPGEFPPQRPVTWSFGDFFDLHLNKRLSKQSKSWWFETPSRPLWRHCNADLKFRVFSASSHYFKADRVPPLFLFHISFFSCFSSFSAFFLLRDNVEHKNKQFKVHGYHIQGEWNRTTNVISIYPIIFMTITMYSTISLVGRSTD